MEKDTPRPPSPPKCRFCGEMCFYRGGGCNERQIWSKELRLTAQANREKELIDKIRRMVGYEPIGITDILHLLVHPDVIDLTRQYVSNQEK